MRFDLYYIKHMSAWLDARILCRTVRTVLSGRRAQTLETGGVQPAPRPRLHVAAVRFLEPQPALVGGHDAE